MPELPEVETVRRGLEKRARDKEIERVEVSGHRTVRRQSPKRVIDELQGNAIHTFRRKGKFLLLDLDGATLGLHLRMSGQLLWRAGADDAQLPHTHARLFFATGERLDFVDARTFGELWMTTRDAPELGHIGPDALEDPDAHDLVHRLRDRRGNLKALLMNQSFIAGIGNIYADEILWTARVRPDRMGSSLSKPAVQRIDTAIHDVLGAAVEARGSTLRDKRYVDLMGEAGSFQGEHHVYDREGLDCHRCGKTIKRRKFANRSAYFCIGCQR